MGHTLTDNRHGLVVNARVTRADGHAEREAAKVIINDARQAAGDASAEITLGADKGYDAQEGFGWAKTVVRSLKKVDQMFVLNMAVYNLVRLRSLAQVRP